MVKSSFSAVGHLFSDKLPGQRPDMFNIQVFFCHRHTPGLLNGRWAPLMDRVSMDMITVDLHSQPQVRVWDRVVLWGTGLPVEEIAEAAAHLVHFAKQTGTSVLLVGYVTKEGALDGPRVLEQNRLNMLLAVLHHHGGIGMFDQDVYVNVVGGVQVTETAADLPVLLAVLSSFRDRAYRPSFRCPGSDLTGCVVHGYLMGQCSCT